MPSQKSTIIELQHPSYVPVLKDSAIYYGGSQMWFPPEQWSSKNYVLHHYGCGTIATADMFLYLALNKDAYRNAVTESVLQGGDSANYKDYISYVRKIDTYYTRTRRWIAVLGPQIANSFNSYARTYDLSYRAKWKLFLSYYDMYEMIEEMLSLDIPVIISIGPNTPRLWGKKGIPFYKKHTIKVPIKLDNSDSPTLTFHTIYRYEAVQNVNSHYVTVTGLIKDPIAATIMLRISSWGKQYYINYEEYRDYITEFGGTFTSSIVQINRTK